MLKAYTDDLSWKREKELFVYDLVHAHTGLPVPEIIHSEPGSTVMTRLPGRPLRYLDLPDRQYCGVLRELGGLLRELHQISFYSFGYLTTRVLEPASMNPEYMRASIERKLRDFGRLGGDSGLRERLERHFGERADAFVPCERAVLCHHDAHDANVLVDGAMITGLVDWEDAVAADPLLDLAKTHLSSSRSDDATLEAIVEGYGPVRDDWHDAVDLYALYHLLELWVWVAETDPEYRDALSLDLAERVGL